MFLNRTHGILGILFTFLFISSFTPYDKIVVKDCDKYTVDIPVAELELEPGQYEVSVEIRENPKNVRYHFFNTRNEWQTVDPKSKSITLGKGKYYCIMIINNECNVRKEFEIK